MAEWLDLPDNAVFSLKRCTLDDNRDHWAGYDADLNAVTALLETLTADPLFAASQASKELFHSNMLAWYLERWPQVRGGLAQA